MILLSYFAPKWIFELNNKKNDIEIVKNIIVPWSKVKKR